MKRITPQWLLAGLLALGCLPVWAKSDAQPAADADPRLQVEATLDQKFDQGKYSPKGADTCLKCHDADSRKPATGIFHNVHGNLGNQNGPMADKQCEACHGPAGNHSRNPRKGQKREPMLTFGPDSPVPVEKQNSVCLSCHTDTQRMGWHASAHAVEDLSCTSCHSLHQAKDPVMDSKLQVETCTSCHAQQKADLHKRTSHPILNGELPCSSCHNPHQSQNEASLKQPSLNESCYECHAEKRGPFLWEHEPVTEDCSLCHSPHGSINQALLNKRVPQLCQECHSVPHANVSIPEGDLKVRGGSCLNCHNQIHGTNHPNGQSLRR
ncbi:TPA: DmsE family decaheme c-type cytochrome [Aeromonas dhakensis]|nr:DmsE family decaheme c-type cytochrome [Aeromonas dhakensis]